MYSFETSVQYLQITEDKGEFENDEIRIIVEKSSDGESYALIYKNNQERNDK